ncbi:MAG: hypothetical protein JSS94_08235 [Bacteroidetes bacterium]|nr:hypothetical protein [Bacteroidota bacterium]
MKKIFLFSIILSATLSSCRKDESTPVYTEPEDIATQNYYDDEAAKKFMAENYLDAQGNIKAFDATDSSDDTQTPLTALNPQTIPSSGVIYIVRNAAQPTPGTTIGDTDVIRIMNKGLGYVAMNVDGVIKYSSPAAFVNTIQGTGVPQVDPMYYYVKNSVMASSSKSRSYYEMEGFQEGLRKFMAFNIPDSDGYNLQGVIIVPSRAAFSRDEHYPYQNINWRNRSFVFNFQVYKSSTRTLDQQ